MIDNIDKEQAREAINKIQECLFRNDETNLKECSICRNFDECCSLRSSICLLFH